MSMNWIRFGPPIVTIPANAGVHAPLALSNKRRKTGPPLNPFGPTDLGGGDIEHMVAFDARWPLMGAYREMKTERDCPCSVVDYVSVLVAARVPKDTEEALARCRVHFGNPGQVVGVGIPGHERRW